MSTTTSVELVDQYGRSSVASLGPLLASGGAGSVYAIEDDPLSVVKLYHPQVLVSQGAEYQQRAEAMLDLRPNLPDIQYQGHRYVQLAWPTHIARVGKKYVGFAMPVLEIDRTRNLELAINEKQAARTGLRTDLGARVTLARQLAGVVAALHAREHYVIDLKPINIQFYPDTLLMAVLDCDGFSIHDHKSQKRFAAPQYTPDYLAPEFQNQRGDPNQQPEQQDRFALAVILFQLLNHGIHPFAGKLKRGQEPSTIEGRIAGSYYPFGIQAHQKIEPPVSSGHAFLPNELRQLFDRAFGTKPDDRPSATEWRDCLESYAHADSGKLTKCAAGHLQFVETACSACHRAGLATSQPRSQAGHGNTAKVPGARAMQGLQPSQSTSPLPIATPVPATPKEKFRGFLAFLAIPLFLWLLWGSIGGAGNYWYVFFLSMVVAGCIGYLSALSDGDPNRIGMAIGFMLVVGLPLFLVVGGAKYVYAWWNETPQQPVVAEVVEKPAQVPLAEPPEVVPKSRRENLSPVQRTPSPPPKDTSATRPILLPSQPKQLSLDEIYEKRTTDECSGLLAIFCREQIRWELCEGR